MTVDEVYVAMVGAWLPCTGLDLWKKNAPADTIGVEFGAGSSVPTSNGSTVGGNLYYLVEGPSGPVRGAGFGYEATYDVSPEGPGNFQLNIQPAPLSGFGATFRYSPNPREFEVDFGSAFFGVSTLLPVTLGESMTPDASAADAAGTCSSMCGVPAGPVETLSSVSDVYAAMAGRWLPCTGRDLWLKNAPADTIGVEFGTGSSVPTSNGGTVGGTLYYLAPVPRAGALGLRSRTRLRGRVPGDLRRVARRPGRLSAEHAPGSQQRIGQHLEAMPVRALHHITPFPSYAQDEHCLSHDETIGHDIGTSEASPSFLANRSTRSTFGGSDKSSPAFAMSAAAIGPFR